MSKNEQTRKELIRRVAELEKIVNSPKVKRIPTKKKVNDWLSSKWEDKEGMTSGVNDMKRNNLRVEGIKWTLEYMGLDIDKI